MGNETILYDGYDYYSVMMDACHYSFVKTHKGVQYKVWALMDSMDFSNNNILILAHQWQQMHHANARC